MSKLGRAGLFAERTARIYTNNNEEISAIDENAVMQNQEDSQFNLTDDDYSTIFLDATNPLKGTLKDRIELIRLSVDYPLFYIDVNLRDIDALDAIRFYSVDGTNYTGVSVSPVNQDQSPLLDITFPNITSMFGYSDYYVTVENLTYLIDGPGNSSGSSLLQEVSVSNKTSSSVRVDTLREDLDDGDYTARYTFIGKAQKGFLIDHI